MLSAVSACTPHSGFVKLGSLHFHFFRFAVWLAYQELAHLLPSSTKIHIPENCVYWNSDFVEIRSVKSVTNKRTDQLFPIKSRSFLHTICCFKHQMHRAGKSIPQNYFGAVSRTFTARIISVCTGPLLLAFKK